ncbi:hypothetical protein CFP56_043250, partial [Quercus suber]
EDEDEDSELDESVDLTTYKVKKFIEREDGTQIATEIAHFSHDHDLKFVNEAQNNQKCNGCARDICPLFIAVHCNGFIYTCDTCIFELDVQCSLTPDILTHEGHEHQLILSSTANYKVVLLVVVEETMFSGVPLVNLHWTLNAQHYHFLKNETKIIGSITVKNVAILLIPNVFLEDPQISSNTYNGNLFRVAYIFNYHPHSILSLKKLKTTLNVTVVVILLKSLSINVPNAISIYTSIVLLKKKIYFLFYNRLSPQNF